MRKNTTTFQSYINIASEHNEEDTQQLPQGNIIGVDESGKGDYFGALIIAAVYVPATEWVELKYHAIRDSKKMTDNQIYEKSRFITERCKCKIITIPPSKYNQMYQSMRNQIDIRAWGHAQAIESILQDINCNNVICDMVSQNEDQIRKHLKEKGNGVTLSQRPKDELNIAVAAASILARRAYLFSLKDLEKKYDMYFSKGAGTEADQTAGAFIKKHGRDKLSDVAKIHFSNTKKAGGYS